MFILKKWGKKHTENTVTSILQDFLEKSCLEHRFSYPWGEDSLFQALSLPPPSPALMKFPTAVVRFRQSSSWEYFSCKDFPRTELISQVTYYTRRKFRALCQILILFKLMIRKRAWSVIPICFLLFEGDEKHWLKLYLSWKSKHREIINK